MKARRTKLAITFNSQSLDFFKGDAPHRVMLSLILFPCSTASRNCRGCKCIRFIGVGLKALTILITSLLKFTEINKNCSNLSRNEQLELVCTLQQQRRQMCALYFLRIHFVWAGESWYFGFMNRNEGMWSAPNILY